MMFSKEAQEQRNVRLAKIAEDHADEALEFLLQHDISDVSREDAYARANDTRYEELVAETLLSEGMFDFNGQNCDDWGDGPSCTGWDGESRRCDCGNRRVSWESDGDFRSMYIYGEAY